MIYPRYERSSDDTPNSKLTQDEENVLSKLFCLSLLTNLQVKGTLEDPILLLYQPFLIGSFDIIFNLLGRAVFLVSCN